MQSFIYKRVFSIYMNKPSVSIKVFYYHANNNGLKPLPNTLHNRFIKYLNKAITLKTNNNNIPNIEIPESLPIIKANQDATNQTDSKTEDINKRNLDNPNVDLSLILYQIMHLRRASSPSESRSVLNIIEKDICKALESLSFEEILLIMNNLLLIIPERLAQLSIYNQSIVQLREILYNNVDKIEPPKIVNFLLLVSLTKTAALRNVLFVLRYIPDMKKLSLEEKSIVSMATFKAGVKLNRQCIETIEDTIHANLDYLISDRGLFVSLLKALRFGGPSEGFSINPISERLLKNESKFDISMAVPILALYAEILKPETRVIKKLVHNSITNIIESRKSAESKTSGPIRAKDISRLLWATSRLNHKMTKNQLVEMDKFIDDRLTELSKEPKEFAGMLLSLWMHKSPKCREKVEYCFQHRIFEPLLNANEDERLKLNLLVECVRIEAPEINIPALLDTKIQSKSMKDCREVINVGKLIKCVEPHLGLYETEIDCPVKSIRIYGITSRHRRLGIIHIDMMNNITCLRDTRKPHGLMNLKLRLVKTLGYFSILLDDDGVTEIESMISIIEEKINSKLKKLEQQKQMLIQ